MKIVNLMNFVRRYDFREENSESLMFQTTKAELELARKFGYDNTFLLQYDALIDEGYIRLFKEEADETTELGLWYEIVRPLTDRVGLPWRGDPDQTWDWHVVPGFSMAYSQREREMLADEAMSRFKEIYGYYPKTVASWLIDTHTVNYLSRNYDISCFAICRDQTHTDAYTLVGGYFNQGYYPSKKNMFTPAQSPEFQVNTPVFRLLGPCPLHNYDEEKRMGNPRFFEHHTCYTLEPIWDYGSDRTIMDFFFRSYFENESLGFAYAQLGQENSFGCGGRMERMLEALSCQLGKLKEYPDVTVMKMCDTGDWFKKTFRQTPPTSVCALSEWDGDDRIQSVYYDSKHYTANLFRDRDKILIRSLYLFDETVSDRYEETPCVTWDATYENLPVIDTLLWEDDDGLLLDREATAFAVQKTDQNSLKVFWKDRSVTFFEDRIELDVPEFSFDHNGAKAEITVSGNRLLYRYRKNPYAVTFQNAQLSMTDGILKGTSHGKITILFER